MKAPYMFDKRDASVSLLINAIGWAIVFVQSLFMPKQ